MSKEEESAAEGKKKKGKLFSPGKIFGVFGLVAALVFMPTAIVLGVGMLPSGVALLISRGVGRMRGITVTAMNLAGCAPFVLQLWTQNNDIEQAVRMVTDPRSIIVMYSAACIGYAIDWAISGLVSSFMVQISGSRMQQIIRRRAELVERWGREVTGEVQTDHQGFLVDDDAIAPKK